MQINADVTPATSPSSPGLPDPDHGTPRADQALSQYRIIRRNGSFNFHRQFFPYLATTLFTLYVSRSENCGAVQPPGEHDVVRN